MKKFNYTSIMQCPRLVKICLNQGVKGSVSDKKLKAEILADKQSALPSELRVFVILVSDCNFRTCEAQSSAEKYGGKFAQFEFWFSESLRRVRYKLLVKLSFSSGSFGL